MIDSHQRVEIARACGWQCIRLDPSKPWRVIGWHKDVGEAGEEDEIPDYVRDLNAIHWAERLFYINNQPWGAKWDMYCYHLARCCFVSEPFTCLAAATAAQRAEAFLKTLGLWTK